VEFKLQIEFIGCVKSSFFLLEKLTELFVAQLTTNISVLISELQPKSLYVPYRNDVYSDGKVVLGCAVLTSKTFWQPSIKQISAYETLLETEYGLTLEDGGFRLNYFGDISEFLEKKIDIIKSFPSEIGNQTFPPNIENIRELATLRGEQCKSIYVESFMLIKGMG